MLMLIPIVFIVWSLFQPQIASNVFIVFFLLLEIWILLDHFTGKPKTQTNIFTNAEWKVFKKYHLYFRFPFTSRLLSPVISGIQLSAFIFGPWLLYRKLWTQAIVIGLNYFVAGKVAVKLNPRVFLHDAVENHGDVVLMEEMTTVDRVCEKISQIGKPR